MKIMLAVPVGDNIPGLFLGCFCAVQAELIHKGHYVGHSISDRVPLDKGRNNIFYSCIESRVNYDYLFWIDSDMLITPEHALTLVKYMDEHPEIDTVTGLYVKKAKPWVPTTYTYENGRFVPFVPTGLEPVEIGAAGLGCMINRVKSLKEKLRPFIGPEGSPFWFDKSCDEDLNYCLVMQHAGMKMMLLPNVSVPHLGAAAEFEMRKKD